MEFARKLFLHKSSNSYIQFLRYGFVAVAALFVDFGILLVLKEGLGINYIIAASISFVLGLITNYLLSVVWVFHSSKVQNKKKEITFFGIIGLVGLGFTDLILWVLTSRLGIYYVISKATAVLIVYFWNFGMRKYYLFN